MTSRQLFFFIFFLKAAENEATETGTVLLSSLF